VESRANVIRTVSQLCRNATREESRRQAGAAINAHHKANCGGHLGYLGYRSGAEKKKHCRLTLHISIQLSCVPDFAGHIYASILKQTLI
jgi:hypothetical protein